MRGPHEVNAAEPFNLHRLKFYGCCSFLLFSPAKNYLGYKTKNPSSFFPQVSVCLAIAFQVGVFSPSLFPQIWITNTPTYSSRALGGQRSSQRLSVSSEKGEFCPLSLEGPGDAIHRGI